MGFMDIFRKKQVTQEDKPITFDKLDSFIVEETNNFNEKSENLRKELKQLNIEFSNNIQNKIPLLKLITLNKRRENEKLKELVLENLGLYIAHLKKLSEDLDRLDKKEAKEYLDSMNSIFNNFSKNSATSFERATILIGKELEEVKEIIKEFVRNFNSKIESNKHIFEKLSLIEDLKNSLKELNDLREIIKNSENSAKDLEFCILNYNKEKQKTEKELEDFKKSSEYLEYIKEQDKIKQENKALNEDIFRLKQKIDFRLLLKYFHSNSKKSKIISHYLDDFQNSLKKDINLEIIFLIKEANQPIDEQKLMQIQGNLANQKIIIENEKLKYLEDSLQRLEQCVLTPKDETEKQAEKIRKFQEKQNTQIMQIKGKIRKIWENVYLDIQQVL